ncbi:MAG: T9SS type A sorting domain-containing protein [Flavobacteriales bacterium]|nr:T9SS type A sorting domain-containing protein [Flavobacteriales bacterium]MDG1780757.1 T9SS type A sorting domain-containing protein [Flavobacteriales bacterium]MDG2244722.1 T9SS type A sorting domain-containing protein [Flavobacteriales bacterium]
MKFQLLILSLFSSLSLLSQDYYWVGGTGNWSDLSHWATSSGDFTSTDLWVEDNTDFILNDDIQLNRIRIFGGNFLANCFSVVLEEDMMITNTGGQTVDFIGSDLEAKEWRITSTGGNYEMDLSALNISDEMAASNGVAYNSVSITGPSCLISGASSFTILEINPTANLSFENGAELEVGLLIADGSEGELITIDCQENGGTGTFVFDSDQTVSYVALIDNHTTGSGTFTAVNSEDNGNTDGWFFEFIDSVNEETGFQTAFGPNPATSQITFSTLPADAQLDLYDAAGRLVLSQQMNGASSANVSDLEKGNYVMIITSSEGVYRSKLAIQ